MAGEETSYYVSVPAAGASATRIDFANDKLEGTAIALRADRSRITLEATEKPVILLFESAKTSSSGRARSGRRGG